MKKMKKPLLTCSVALVLFIASSVSVFAGPGTGGTVTPNSFKISPSTVNILTEKLSSNHEDQPA